MRKLRDKSAAARSHDVELPTEALPETLGEALALLDDYRTRSIELRMMLDATQRSKNGHANGSANGNGNGNGHGRNGVPDAAVDRLRADLELERAVGEQARRELAKEVAAGKEARAELQRSKSDTERLRAELDAMRRACEQARAELAEERQSGEAVRNELFALKSSGVTGAEGAALEQLQEELESERLALQRLREQLVASESLCQRLEEEILSEQSTNAELRAQLTEKVSALETYEQVSPGGSDRSPDSKLRAVEMELYLLQQRTSMLVTKLAEVEHERDRALGTHDKGRSLTDRIFGRRKR